MSELFAALAKAQSSYKPLLKDEKVNTGKFSFTYASIANVLDCIRDANFANGIGYIQKINVVDNLVMVETVITHTSGEELSTGTLRFPVSGDVRALGSLITYLRRYGLYNAFGLAPEDDDGAGSITSASRPMPTPMPTPLPDLDVILMRVKDCQTEDDFGLFRPAYRQFKDAGRIDACIQLDEAISSRKKQLNTVKDINEAN